MASAGSYDEVLYSVLCNEGNIGDFFDKIFDFLYRRTDYFKIRNDESENLGLHSGEAENIIKSIFCKYMELARSEQNNQLNADAEPAIMDGIVEKTVYTSSEPDTVYTSDGIVEETVLTSSEPDTVYTSGELENGVTHSELESPKVISKDIKENLQTKRDSTNQSDVKLPIMDPDSYNGAHYDDYSWAQTIKDIDIRIKVPSDITSGKQVQVSIQPMHLQVKLTCSNNLLKGNEWIVLKEGTLSWRINVEESIWTLVPREHIHVCLKKMKDSWWDSFFVGEPKIDLKAIDPSIAYEELDQESQAKIRELMYNEHLKSLGKPNIQQTKLNHILKEAWNAEGSPFKGQPFDPSIVNLQNSENLPL